jgi:hypothetical protein
MHGRLALVGSLLVAATSIAHAHPRTNGRAAAHTPHAVTVYLDRDGDVTDEGVEIPRYRGGDRAWQSVVACVQRQYAPFAVDVVDRRPAGGEYITAMIGGRASLLGLDDRTTNGVGPYSGGVLPTAVVHIFSEVGTGERDVENLCAVTAHEVAHSLGLDHEIYCGDVMSYYLDRCGARSFVDADAPCGETSERACGNGAESQNSYRRLGELVGFREARQPRPQQPRPPQQQPRPPRQPQLDPWTDDTDSDSTDATDDTTAPQDPYAVTQHSCGDQPQVRTSNGRATPTQQTYTVRRGNRVYRIRVIRR